MKQTGLFNLRNAVCAGAFVLLFNAAPSQSAENTPAATPGVTATTADTEEADKAWREVRKAIQPPMPRAEWQDKEPSADEVKKYYTEALVKGADKAKEFYTKYPKHPKAAEAQKTEYDLLTISAQRFGDTSQADRLAALESVRLNDPNATEDERLRIRIEATHRLMNGLPQTQEAFEKSVRALQKDFPKRPEVYQAMMALLESSEGDKAKAIAKEIVDSPAPDEVKAMAKGILSRMDAVGKPVDIQYTAVDGRKVDLTNIKGKVVLVDFWATWCGPCMGELPHVKEAYEKLHDKGFDIVGISFDQDKDALQKIVKEKEMTWPQYFDGKGWQNKFGQQFGINAIPTMWLIDKKGNLRDIEARGDLEGKVTKLLAE